MMDWWVEYGLFIAKVVTLMFIFLLLVSALAKKRTQPKKLTLKVQRLDEQLHKLKQQMQASLLSPKDCKKQQKQAKKQLKKRDQQRKKLYVLNFQGDLRASGVDMLREEINAILTIATPKDEVLVCLSSLGGTVPEYGLGASQLDRLKQQKIRLVVAVDKYAASGGYLMACMSDWLIAAPFAIVGSIGVVTQQPNFHQWLKKRNIEFDVLTAGEHKRTLTWFGQNTRQGKEKMQQQLDQTHELFQQQVQQNRTEVELKKIATGDFWYGQQALELKLIDAIQTSDDYLIKQLKTADVVSVSAQFPKNWRQKFPFFSQISSAIERLGLQNA